MKDTPQFGVDYDIGWIGFTYTGGFISDGIAYGERRERVRLGLQPGIIVTHAFICTGEGAGIEAHMETGVARFYLAKYTSDPNCKIYFRKPKGWTLQLGARIAAAAANNPPFGCRYDKSLIAADAFCYTYAGNYLDRLTRGQLKRFLCWALSHDGEFICSETAAFVMQQQPELAGKGCLKQPAYTIDPQQLFEDNEVFEI